jgi:class 3 adenylate cyclase
MTYPASGTLTPPAGGQVCTLFAVDIAQFTRADRDDDIRLYLHEELYRILGQAFDASGIPWIDCFAEDRGDGALVVIPPNFGAKATLDPLPERLRTLIRRHNHVSRDAACIQLRAAVHMGPLEHDGHGFIGTDVNFLFRMMNARSLSAALVNTGADLACIISEDVYRNVVCRHPSMISPDDFRLIKFQVKRTRARARLYLPGVQRF